MSASPSLALSFAAGIIAFLSPCILPLVPSYLSFIGGTSAREGDEVRRGSVILRTVLFVAGFTLVFVVLGLVFSGSGALFSGAGVIVNVVAGALVVLLGLNIIFDFWKALNVERRFHFAERPAGHAGAVLIGMAFGAGWTPCIGPILASILLLAGTSGSLVLGTLYLTAFSLGLGVPFLLAGIFFDRVAASLRRIRPALPAIKTASGIVLVLVGILIALGRLQRLSSMVLVWGARLDAWNQTHEVTSGVVFGVVFAALAALPLGVVLARRTSVKRGVTRLAIASALAAVGLAIGLLSALGVISVAGWIAGWLSFAGL